MDVPLLAGTNADEGTYFVLGIPLVVGPLLPLNEKGLNATLEYFFTKKNVGAVRASLHT